MLGSIIGDIAGSRFEFDPIKSKDFELIHEMCTWTDDTILTLALAEALDTGRDIAATYRDWVRRYPTSYGHHFWDWANAPGAGPYGSYGNGAAMRVSAAAWFAGSLEQCLDLARRSAEVTHDHPEGIRGAQATAAAIYCGLCGMDREAIRSAISAISGFDLDMRVADIRPDYVFEIKSWRSVPQAIVCALEATSFEDAIRNAVSLGGDADTQAAIAGSVAEPLFGIPADLRDAALARFTPEMLAVLDHACRSASTVDRMPPDRATLAAVPAWSQISVAEWENARRVKFGTEPEDPRLAEELDKCLFFGGYRTHAPAPLQPPRRSFLARMLGR